MGKTYASCLLINKFLEAKPKANVLILVAIAENVKQWNNAIKTTCGYNTNINVMTIQYYQYHNLNITCDLLIVDEIHMFYSEERIGILLNKTITYKFFLGLSATPENNNNTYFTKIQSQIPIISTITEEEAIYNGWISDYIELNLPVDLSETERVNYEELCADIEAYIDYFTVKSIENIVNESVNGFNLALACISGKDSVDAFTWATKVAVEKGYEIEVDADTPYDVIQKAKEVLGLTRRRKVLLQHIMTKSQVVLELLDIFDTRQTMLFSEDTLFADSIFKQIKEKYERISDSYAVIYHTNLETQIRTNKKTGNEIKFGKTRLKNEAIERIIDGTSKVLVTAKALDTGVDVAGISAAIITSGTSNYVQQKQRSGRTKRISDDKLAIIVNVYGRNTKDESGLSFRQRKSDGNKIHWIQSITDIYKYID